MTRTNSEPARESSCVNQRASAVRRPLVAAFAGKERILNAYRHAVREKYRFFSYGDAMFLTPGESA